jgi:uncharacterized membrane protein
VVPILRRVIVSDLIAIAYPDKDTAETVRHRRRVTPDKVLPEIRQYGGDVLQTSLDDESEARLREVLEGTAHAAAPVA